MYQNISDTIRVCYEVQEITPSWPSKRHISPYPEAEHGTFAGVNTGEDNEVIFSLVDVEKRALEKGTEIG